MKSADVRQLDALSELFAEALAYCRPRSVAVLGIAGGNGLEHVDRNTTTRVVGVDVNPGYLDEARRRFGAQGELELYCVDLAEQVIEVKPVELVHAALVFEHAGTGRCLENALSLVANGGALSVVLQLPSETEQGVGASPFPSLQRLKEDFSLIPPERFCELLEPRGFRLEHETRRSLPAGKEFWMGIFRG